MSSNQPNPYSLEFYGDADFWGPTGDEARRTFIMPQPDDASQFLAFGVLSPSEELRFVAYGQVADHLGDFIARMVQARASVELYALPPLPRSVLSPYLKGSPYEQTETDTPPPAPKMGGDIVTGAGTQSLSTVTSSLWPTGNYERRVVAVPLSGLDGYLVFGLCKPPGTYRYQVPFVAWLMDLVEFFAQMQSEGASVEISSTPPGNLPQYVNDFLAGQSTLAAARPVPEESASDTKRFAQAA